MSFSRSRDGNVRFFSWILCATLCSLAVTASGQRFVRRTKVRVSAPTRMDWVYAVGGRSLATTDKLLPDYESTIQRYDLYAPRPGAIKTPMPLVIFVSYKNSPMGWELLGQTCFREGAIFVEPYKAGNSIPMAKRVRIVLDCLDDVRRRYAIDPDRTYIAGYSGGAGIAAHVAMTLPEFFGGVIASSIAVAPPLRPWQKDRARNRLSIAVLCGQKEPAGFEMSNVQLPILRGMGIRTYCHVVPLLGHSPPAAPAFDAAFRWLEQGVHERSQSANRRPAIRIDGSPTREEWAASALADCKGLLEDDAQIHTGLALLQELRSRWADLPEAAEAETILRDYASRPERPWVINARRERLAQTQLLAETYDRASQALIGVTKTQRAYYAQGAIDNYRVLITDAQDDGIVNAARIRIAPLQKLVDNVPIQIRSTIRPVPGATAEPDKIPDLPISMIYSITGPIQVRRLLKMIKQRLTPRDPPIVVLEDQIEQAGLTLDRYVTLQCDRTPIHEVLYAALTPIGLSYRYENGRVEILPISDMDETKEAAGKRSR